jgi:hypothetical protein
MSQFAVIHVQKNAGKGAALGRHIDRTHTPDNADKSLSSNNMYCYSEPTPTHPNGYKMFIRPLSDAHLPPLKERVDKRISEGYTGKTAIRKDAMRQLNVILTGSHEQMAAIGSNSKSLHSWIYDNYRFIAREYGRRNIVGFVVHMDEATPHIHATVVPLTPDGRLSAKEVVGDQSKLKGLQDRYGEAMGKYGLTRGKSNSKAKHIETREYYRHINAAGTAAEAAIEQAPAVELPPTFSGREAYRQQLQQQVAIFAANSARKLKESEYKRLTLARENSSLKSQILAKKMATPSPALASYLNSQRTIRQQQANRGQERKGKGMSL